MNLQKNILIVDDEPRLRKQLVRLTREIIPDWQIIEADNYITAKDKIDTNKINILVSDLYLKPNEERNKDKNYNPSGIKLAEYLRNKQPDSFIYIVTSYLNSLISKNQLIEYIDIGVNDFLDRNVNPFEKFSQKFEYQLKTVEKVITSNKNISCRVVVNKDIETYISYWILISDLSDKNYRELIKECLYWSKSSGKDNVFFDVVSISDIERKYYSNLNFQYDDPYPLLFIADSLDFLGAIKLSSQVFDLNRKHLFQLLNSFNTRILKKYSILNIKKEMQTPEYWKWLKNHTKIKGFSHEKGRLEFHDQDSNPIIITEKIEKVITMENGNYTENIEGNYIQK